jgi:hypothetical protein
MGTLTNKLDHIGWENYLPNPSPLIKEYLELKETALKSGQIRRDINLSSGLYYLTEVE